MLHGLDVALTKSIVGCAIEVHGHLGPGLLETVYETALSIELSAAALSFKRQVGVPLYYKGRNAEAGHSAHHPVSRSGSPRLRGRRSVRYDSRRA